MPTTEELLEELVRMKAIELKAAIGNQNDTILELNKSGFSQGRIAALLGTTPGTVNTAIQRSKKPAKKKSSVKETQR